jgi:hypothetical protein
METKTDWRHPEKHTLSECREALETQGKALIFTIKKEVKYQQGVDVSGTKWTVYSATLLKI